MTAPSAMSARRVLVTGATGFIARHVVPHFVSAGWHVRGVSRHPVVDAPWPNVKIEPCDLTADVAALAAVVARARPDLVVHLAAMIPEDRQSAAWPWLELNGRATEQLLTVCSQLQPAPRVVILSSGAVYGGGSADGAPFDESSPIAPATSYGVSKVLVEALATRAAAASGLPVLRLRLFNVTGPGEPAHLAIGSFVRQIGDIQSRGGDTLVAGGDLSTARDYLDVRDAAGAVFLASTAADPGPVLNVCSGRATRIAVLLEQLLQLSGLSGRVAIRARTASPDPIRTQVGDPSRLMALTGWRPRFELEESLRDLLAERRTTGALVARSESVP